VYKQYFGVKKDQVPLIIVQTTDGKKYLESKVKPDQIASWIKEYNVMHCCSHLGFKITGVVISSSGQQSD